VIEDAWRLLNSVNEWVRYADAKASGALAGSGVLAGALATAGLSDKFKHASELAVVFGVASGFCAVVAAAIALWSLLPTLRAGEPASLIYFEHVARRFKDDTAGHAAAVRELINDDALYFEQVAAQVWANSKVARSKFLASAWALAALGFAVVLGGIAAIITLA
jgi:hypothetical protein